MEQPLLPYVADHVGSRLFVVLWGGMAAASFGTGPVLVLVGACAIGLSVLGALAVAGVGWMVLDGFVAHSYGDLTFAGPDLLLLAVVLLVVSVPAVLSGLGARR